MLKDKIKRFIQRIEEIQIMPDWEKRREALDVFFTQDLLGLELSKGEYFYQDKTCPTGIRSRHFFYGEEGDGSDVNIHVWTGGDEGQDDRIRISYLSIDG